MSKKTKTTKQTKKAATKKQREEKLTIMRQNTNVTKELANLWGVK